MRSWKNASGGLKVPEKSWNFFVTKRVGTLNIKVQRKILFYSSHTSVHKIGYIVLHNAAQNSSDNVKPPDNHGSDAVCLGGGEATLQNSDVAVSH